jgi:hypothetical protein
MGQGSEPAPRDVGSFLGLMIYFERNWGRPPPPPPPPPNWGLQDLMEGLLSDSGESEFSDQAYYANSGYVNAVDVSKSSFEHSWVWTKEFKIGF